MVSAILTAARARFGSSAGLSHIAWGSVAGRVGLIFLVEPGERARIARARAARGTVSLDTKLGRVRVCTGLREVARGTQHVAQASPGFACGVRAGPNVGSLGCLTDGNGFAIIAGHVAVAVGVAVTATAASGATVPLGVVQLVRNDQDIDSARVGPVPGASILGLASPPAAVRDLDDSDVGLELRISAARGTFNAKVDVASEAAVFVDPMTLEQRPMNALIRLDTNVTMHGDSGAPAMDATGLLVGFVEGVADGRTYLIPARRAIDAVT
jgi:hypothetical protein